MRSRINRHLAQDFTDREVAEVRYRYRLSRAWVATAQLNAPPPEFAGRDYAVFLLHVAAEIEHALMVQYLFAAYSLGGQQVPSSQRNVAKRFQDTILGIAKEEMGHLITVQNVLLLLGAPLNFDRQDYPWDSEFYPFTLTLRPLTLDSLATYVSAESELGWNTRLAKSVRARARIAAGSQINAVGKLYSRLIEVLRDRELVPESAFDASTASRQASFDEWGRNYRKPVQTDGDRKDQSAAELIVCPCDSRQSAIAVLREIGEQGEATHGIPATGRPRNCPPVTLERSHFERFRDIYLAMEHMADQGRSLVREVAENPRTNTLCDVANRSWSPSKAPAFTYTRESPTGKVITNDLALAWAHLFNLRYRMILMNATHALHLETEGAQSTKRGYLINRLFAEMYNLRAISGRLVQLPLDRSGSSGLTAGPPFEMPYTLKIPDSEASRWRMHRDLLAASSLAISNVELELDDHPSSGGETRDYLAALSESDRKAQEQMDRWLTSEGRLLTAKPPRR